MYRYENYTSEACTDTADRYKDSMELQITPAANTATPHPAGLLRALTRASLVTRLYIQEVITFVLEFESNRPQIEINPQLIVSTQVELQIKVCHHIHSLRTNVN